jgi:hypothetical protein
MDTAELLSFYLAGKRDFRRTMVTFEEAARSLTASTSAWAQINRAAELALLRGLNDSLRRMLEDRERVGSAGDLRAAQEFEPGQEFAYSGSGLDADELAQAARTSPAIGHEDPAEEVKPTRASAMIWEEWQKQTATVLDDNARVFERPPDRAPATLNCRCVVPAGELVRDPCAPGTCPEVAVDLAAQGHDLAGATLLMDGQPIGTVTSGRLTYDEGPADEEPDR